MRMLGRCPGGGLGANLEKEDENGLTEMPESTVNT